MKPVAIPTVGKEKELRKIAKKRILYTHHATVQMNLEERMITTDEVRDVLFKGKVIEERIIDPRGPTFLLSSKTREKRVVHVVCSPKEEYLAIVTAYIPDPAEWTNNFTKRKKP